MYKDIVIDNNENIIFKKENLNFEIYENNFFDIIQIIGMAIVFFVLFQNIFTEANIIMQY